MLSAAFFLNQCMAVNHRRANFERLLKNLIKNTPRSTLNTIVFKLAKNHLIKKYPGLKYNPNKNNATVRNIVNSKGFARQVNEAKRLVAQTEKLIGPFKAPNLSEARLAEARAKVQKMLAKNRTPVRTVLSPPRKKSIARSIGVTPRRLF